MQRPIEQEHSLTENGPEAELLNQALVNWMFNGELLPREDIVTLPLGDFPDADPGSQLQRINVSVTLESIPAQEYIHFKYKVGGVETDMLFSFENSSKGIVAYNAALNLIAALRTQPADSATTLFQLHERIKALCSFYSGPSSAETTREFKKIEEEPAFVTPETILLPYELELGVNNILFAFIDCGLGAELDGFNLVENTAETGLRNSPEKAAFLQAVIAAELAAQAQFLDRVYLRGANRPLLRTVSSITFVNPRTLRTTQGLALYAHFTIGSETKA